VLGIASEGEWFESFQISQLTLVYASVIGYIVAVLAVLSDVNAGISDKKGCIYERKK
jgi:hypothetical protein